MTAKDKKKLYYAQLWPHGVGMGGSWGYAFETDAEREKWMHQRRFVIEEEHENVLVSYADYEDMQRRYGNNFVIMKKDHAVVNRLDAVTIRNMASDDEVEDYDFF